MAEREGGEQKRRVSSVTVSYETVGPEGEEIQKGFFFGTPSGVSRVAKGLIAGREPGETLRMYNIRTRYWPQPQN